MSDMNYEQAKKYEGANGEVWIRSLDITGSVATADKESDTAIVAYIKPESNIVKVDDFPLDLLEPLLSEKPDSDLYPPYSDDYIRDLNKWNIQQKSIMSYSPPPPPPKSSRDKELLQVFAKYMRDVFRKHGNITDADIKTCVDVFTEAGDNIIQEQINRNIQSRLK